MIFFFRLNILFTSGPLGTFLLLLWHRWTKTYTFKSPHTPLTPLFQKPTFTLGLDPQIFNWWANKGFLTNRWFSWSYWRKLFLIEKYQLPKSEFSRYCHFINSLTCNFGMKSMTPMEYLCTNFDKLKGNISIIYSILTSIPVKLGYMEQWERDLNETLELKDWHTLAQNALASLVNISIIEAKQLYISFLCHGTSSLCFRGCGHKGTMFHTWWLCPTVKHFWNRVYVLFIPSLALI